MSDNVSVKTAKAPPQMMITNLPGTTSNAKPQTIAKQTDPAPNGTDQPTLRAASYRIAVPALHFKLVNDASCLLGVLCRERGVGIQRDSVVQGQTKRSVRTKQDHSQPPPVLHFE